MKELINTYIKHIGNMITNIEGYNPNRTPEHDTASYWCGRQSATFLMDLLDTLNKDGTINLDERIKYGKTISDLYNRLDTVYQGGNKNGQKAD